MGVGLAAFLLYLSTMSPTISNAFGASDGGELITVASVLGVAHPPGYGLYLLSARGALEAFWFLDEPALRTNVLSALFASAAASVAVIITFRTLPTQPIWGAALAGAAFAVSPVLWEQAIVTEVYTLHALLTASAILAVIVLCDGGATWPAPLALGALVAHHPTGWFVALPLWLVIWMHRGWRHTVLLAVPAFLVDASAISYLVWRADAEISWMQDRSVGALWQMISGTAYRAYWEPSPTEFLATFPASLRMALMQLPLPLWPGALLGVALMWSARPRLVVALAGTLIALILMVTVYRADGREPYLIPCALTLALIAGWGTPVLARHVQLSVGRRFGRAALALALCASVAWVAAEALVSGRSLRGDRTAETQLLAVLASAPPQAIIETARDEDTFGLWYLTTSRGIRADVTVRDTRGVAPVLIGKAN